MRLPLLAIASFLAATMVATAQEEAMITIKDVPPAALAAAIAAAGGVNKFDSVGLDTDNGTATYEFAVKRSDGTQIEVDILADGTVEEVEETITMDNVPSAVMNTLKKYFPDMQASAVEKSTRTNFEVFYEFEGKNDKGEELDVEIRADGKQILITDDLAG